MTHLLFADVSFIFCSVNNQNASCVANILKKYERSSGQVVNLDKSAICFSKNVREEEKVEISLSFGQRQRNDMGMYLGLSAVVGRSKKRMLEFIKERVQTKIEGWKVKIFKYCRKRNYAQVRTSSDSYVCVFLFPTP